VNSNESPDFSQFRPLQFLHGVAPDGTRELNGNSSRLRDEEALNDDKLLIEQALAGQTDSFGELVRKYQDRLYNTLVHVTGSCHEAEEIAQDAMLQAFSKLSSFRGHSSFYTWLYRIAFNLSVSRQRKQRPRVSLDQMQESVGVDPIDNAELPEEVVERDERAVQVRAALSKLSDEYRAILVLREMEDCDYETIADVLNVPIGTVRSRLHRARMSLRNHLSPAIEGH